MQVLYLIGNGFDINLNMKTRYTEFCEFYQGISTESSVLKNLKENIRKDVYTWSDLEFRLGEYTEQLNTFEEFEEIYDDLLEKFGDYLQEVEDSIDWGSANIDKFKMHLSYPERYLMQKEINDITKYKEQFAKSQWKVDIITFNYTRSIERLLNEELSGIIGTHHDSYNVSLRKIYHIHGDLNNMVLGINDLSQLKNKNFHNNRKVLNAFIKEYNNRRQGHTVDEILEARISTANLICIFGSSLGKTDKLWWEKIGKHLLDNNECRLIIFTSTNVKPKRAIHKKGDYEDELKDIFFTRANFSDSDRDIVNNRVYVRANTNIFSGLLK